MSAIDRTLTKVARLDADIASLRARLESKLDERQALVEQLLADGEAIRIAISGEPVVPAPAAPLALAPQHVARVLTDEQVREIRNLAGTMSQGMLAQKYGISQPSVNAIIHRRSYKDVA